MIYNELCHKETDWSKAIKQLLITLVAVVLGITAMSGYAKKELPVFKREGHSEPHSAYPTLESNSHVNEGKIPSMIA